MTYGPSSGGGGGATPLNPFFTAVMSLDQALPFAVSTIINFDTIVEDPDNKFNTATYRWTPGIIGTARIDAFLALASIPSAVVDMSFDIGIYQNNVLYNKAFNFTGQNSALAFILVTGCQICENIPVAAVTDFFDIRVTVLGDGSNSEAYVNYSRFSGMMMQPPV